MHTHTPPHHDPTSSMLRLPFLQSAVLYIESMLGQENVQTLAMVRKPLNTLLWHGSIFVNGATKGAGGGQRSNL